MKQSFGNVDGVALTVEELVAKGFVPGSLHVYSGGVTSLVISISKDPMLGIARVSFLRCTLGKGTEYFTNEAVGPSDFTGRL